MKRICILTAILTLSLATSAQNFMRVYCNPIDPDYYRISVGTNPLIGSPDVVSFYPFNQQYYNDCPYKLTASQPQLSPAIMFRAGKNGDMRGPLRAGTDLGVDLGLNRWTASFAEGAHTYDYQVSNMFLNLNLGIHLDVELGDFALVYGSVGLYERNRFLSRASGTADGVPLNNACQRASIFDISLGANASLGFLVYLTDEVALGVTGTYYSPFFSTVGDQEHDGILRVSEQDWVGNNIKDQIGYDISQLPSWNLSLTLHIDL